jgi:hypothetical protein
MNATVRLLISAPTRRPVHATWRMQKDTICTEYIHTGSNGRNFAGWKILRRPAHGVAGVQSSVIANSFAYQPRGGFLGKDSFSLLVQVQANPTPYILTINVDVDVVPKL